MPSVEATSQWDLASIEKMLRFAFSFIVFQNDKGMARWLLMMACSLTVV
jgi:hypothetical protein